DVEKLQSFAESIGMDSPTRLRTGDIQQFLVWLNELGMSTTSIARVLSGVKAFFTFLAIEGEIKANPAELIETPRLSRKLPDFLHVSEIEAIISAIDLSRPEGMRNKAIVETLYGCGLRVSELTDLKISNLFFEIDFI